MEPIVSFSHVSMEFPGVKANDDVSLDIFPGEIFALVGENGAGKSTLMNILYGIHTPTSGTVTVKGQTVSHFSPKTAISRGVGMVHQHFMLVPSFTAAQNIVLSREPKKYGILYDLKKANEIAARLSADYGLSIDPHTKIQDMSVGQQQRVEILKTLYRGADILILDEPTAVLTPQETDELFAVLRQMAAEQGMTILIITHKLYEVMAISHRVGVMRQGKLVGVERTQDVNERILSSMMVGRDLPETAPRETENAGGVLLDVSQLQVADNRGLPAVNGLSLQVHAGEILGIAAVEGNGQSELLEAIAGMRPFSGTVTVCGHDTRGMSPGEIRKLGLAHVPEDRLTTGVDAQGSITDNLILGKHRQKEFVQFGFHRKKAAIEQYAQGLFTDFDIRAAGIDTPVGSLSGGNMQKVVIAREFSQDAQCYLIAQPTRGVDIGAIAFIHEKILEKRNHGAAILLCSADLDEVLALSDRVITLYEGRITGEFAAGTMTKAEVGLHMTSSGKEAAP